MPLWRVILDEARTDLTGWAFAAYAVTALLVRVLHRERRGLKGTLGLLFVHVVAVAVAGTLVWKGSAFAREVRFVALTMVLIAFVGMASTLVFGVLLPRVKVGVSRILQDIF